MNHLKTLSEQKLRELLQATLSELSSRPNDINLSRQRRSLEEEISYVQHFGNSRKRRGYR